MDAIDSYMRNNVLNHVQEDSPRNWIESIQKFSMIFNYNLI